MATTYDPQILRKFAERLYRQAEWMTARCTGLGFAGGLAGSMIVGWLRPALPPGLLLWLIPVGMVLGYVYGRDRGFYLRLEAQRTLWFVQVEENTRPQLKSAATNPQGEVR